MPQNEEPHGHPYLVALAILLQVGAAVAWFPLNLASIVTAVRAADVAGHTGNLSDRVFSVVTILSASLVQLGWPTLGVPSWVSYRKHRRAGLLVAISCLLYAHVLLGIGILLLYD